MDFSNFTKYSNLIGFAATTIIVSSIVVINSQSDEIAQLKEEVAQVKTEVVEINEFFKKLRPPEQRQNPQVQQNQQDPSAQAPPMQPPPQGREVSVSIKDNPFQGNSKAEFVLVEISEYQCPFCAQFFKRTYNMLKAEYIDTGKIGYTFKDFPLDFHRQAPKASEAAHCAGDQGKYWEMHNVLFMNQKNLFVPDLKNHAKFLRLNEGKFNECLDGGKYTSKVAKNTSEVRSLGFGATPTFIFGKNKNGIVTGTVIQGAKPFEYFQSVIDSQLNK